MWLSDLFSGGQVNSAASQVQQTNATPAGAQALNRQIQSFAPGQTIQGEIVSRNGSEVQIKLSDDMVLNARVDQNMQLEVGKTMTFEVKNNGHSLTLSPLFANTATDANVMKALDMAAMPVNQTTISMTGLMMEAGLSIDRNSLQQMFREVNAFRGADMSNIVDLHKLGLPVNEQNLEQIASYKNLTHQLVDGMNTVLDALPDTVQGMLQEGNAEGAAEMFRELLDLVRELPPEEAGAADQTQVSAEGAAGSGQVQQGAVTVQDGAVTDPGTGSAIPGAQQSTETVKMIISETAAQIADANTETLLNMTGKGSGSAADMGEILGGIPDGLQGALYADAKANVLTQEGAPAVIGMLQTVGEAEADMTQAGNNAVPSDAPEALARHLSQIIRANGGAAEAYQGLIQQFADAARSGDLAEQAGIMQKMIQQGLNEKNPMLLRGLMSDKPVQKMLADGLSKLWTIEPKDVADPGKVDELYQRLDRQLKSLNHILERGGQTDSAAFKAVNNMTQNLDFLQQLNQAYTYVQLPLRLQQGDAHGDLYVYTNKRNLAARDGQISALLHLDMEHLGPVDVYVAMQSEKVSTRFYVQDDAMLDFLEQHMDLLTERLQKRGYDCSFAMQVRNKNEEPESGLNGLMAQEKGHSIAQYAFDMRA